MKILHTITFVLLIVGGLNIGLTTLGYNVLNMVAGSIPNLEKLIYVSIGLSAVYELITHKNNCKDCSTCIA